ncbi:NUDIX hydrolase [Isoptericola sp. BMS4]|uniref:NUDIX hydrolase n=1 Tax=Isoptericola sp. BMS4 TaxID=2527875 RepID=UPI00351A61FC
MLALVAVPRRGGRAGGDVRQAAVRETAEEAGLVVEAVKMLGERVHPKTDRLMGYVAYESVGPACLQGGGEAGTAVCHDDPRRRDAFEKSDPGGAVDRPGLARGDLGRRDRPPSRTAMMIDIDNPSRSMSLRVDESVLEERAHAGRRRLPTAATASGPPPRRCAPVPRWRPRPTAVPCATSKPWSGRRASSISGARSRLPETEAAAGCGCQRLSPACTRAMIAPTR